MEEEQKEITDSSPDNKKVSGLNPKLGVIIAISLAAVIAGVVFLRSNATKSTKTDVTQNQTIPPIEENVDTAVQEEQSVEGVTDVSSTNENLISVEGGNYYFQPNEIKVKKGQEIKISFTNAGGNHDFVIDEFNVRTKLTSSGETVEISFILDEEGIYEFYCSVGNHREMGMTGTLIVE